MVELVHNFPLGLARGLIPRYTHECKFGRNSDIGTSFETLWDEGGLYSFPSSAQTMTISSDNANDTAAGTGARSIIINGLDGDWNLLEIEATLNGTSGVTIGTDLLRVFRLYNQDVGSNAVNVGNIYVGTGTITSGKPTNVFARIEAGFGQTAMGIYTVPINKKAYLKRVYFSCEKGKGVKMRLFKKENGFGWRLLHTGALHENYYDHTFTAPQLLNAKTDVDLRVVGDAGTTEVSGGFEMILIDDEV